jgi:hypothetical protein
VYLYLKEWKGVEGVGRGSILWKTQRTEKNTGSRPEEQTDREECQRAHVQVHVRVRTGDFRERGRAGTSMKGMKRVN